MKDLKAQHPEAKSSLSARRKNISPKVISNSQTGFIKTTHLEPQTMLPLVVQPNLEGVKLSVWAESNHGFIQTNLLNHGAILFRNFKVDSADEFESFALAISGGLLEYKERSSPRSPVKGNIYTSTDYPADQSIFLHNENSYQHSWPMKILFYCATSAEQGGETPIADCRKVFQRISPEIQARFIEKGWMYVRNFGDGFGLPWQTVFQTTDRAVVEDHCRKNGIQVEWKEGDRLRTRSVLPVVTRHPNTGEQVWFNHATFFHVSTLPPLIRESLKAGFKEEDLPTNTYYGDGSKIEDSVMDVLRDAYQQEKVVFPWQQGDVLLLDNMLVAHGRNPYAGARKVLVAMCDPYGNR